MLLTLYWLSFMYRLQACSVYLYCSPVLRHCFLMVFMTDINFSPFQVTRVTHFAPKWVTRVTWAGLAVPNAQLFIFCQLGVDAVT